MSKNVAMFVDVANLYYSARGQDVDVDYVALLKAATKGRDLIRAYAYSGLDPENENQRKFIDFLGKNGYKVLTKDIRKFGDGRVKANLDIELVVDLFRLADRMDIAVIVSGDGDFAPAITALQDKGIRCEVISFRPNTSSDLIAVADEFIDIMKIASIGRNSKEARAARGMSAPEMPAKEVVPEFGFREASPGVAKAALAALREPRPSRGGTGGRGRGRPAAEAEEPEEAAAATATTSTNGDGAEGEGRRRRRRRGGRGRGRGRTRDAQETPESPEGEPGWVELDDLSQLAALEGIGDVAEEREYRFEEADAATLAELGLTPEDLPAADASAEEATEAPKKKPARRRTAKKADADASAEAATGADADAEAPKKMPARRRTAKKADADASAEAATGADADAEAPKKKPARRSSSRKTAAKGDADGGTETEKKPARRRTARKADGEPQTSSDARDAGASGTSSDSEGIWQRFRSGRTTGRSS